MKKSLLFVALMLLIVNTFSLFGIFASAETAVLTDAYLLNEGNWTNLPGYEYVSPDVKDENGTKYPAEVAFSEDANGTGINMKVKGYYQSLSGDEQGNGYAGIVLNEKISVKDFSITLTINKLGASSSASPADDGWIGIGLMSKENLWHTANTSVNSGNGQFFVDNAEVVNGKIVPFIDHISETCQYYALFFHITDDKSYAAFIKENFGPNRKSGFDHVGTSNVFIGNYLRLFWLYERKEYDMVLSESVEYFYEMSKKTGTLWSMTKQRRVVTMDLRQ